MIEFSAFAVPKTETSLITIPPECVWPARHPNPLGLAFRNAPFHLCLRLSHGLEVVRPRRRYVPKPAGIDGHDREQGHVPIHMVVGSPFNFVLNFHAVSLRLIAISVPQGRGVVENFRMAGETGAWAIAQDMIKLEFRE